MAWRRGVAFQSVWVPVSVACVVEFSSGLRGDDRGFRLGIVTKGRVRSGGWSLVDCEQSTADRRLQAIAERRSARPVGAVRALPDLRLGGVPELAKHILFLGQFSFQLLYPRLII